MDSKAVKWLFQDIADLKSKCIYGKRGPADYNKRLEAFHKALRKNIGPEKYVRYLLCQCDIYVDVSYILVNAEWVYGKYATADKVMGWISKHAEPHHILC